MALLPLNTTNGLLQRQLLRTAATYSLASGASVAASGTTSPVTGIAKGDYVLTVLPANTSITIQSLGPDGTTWIDAGAINSTGIENVRIGEGASLRLRNGSGGALNINASLT